MSTKYVPPPMKSSVPKMPTTTVPSVSIPSVSAKAGGSTITKFLPFICAGAAVGVSILALKELKKIKAEMVLVKTQQNNIQSKAVTDPVLSKKLEQLEDQLKRVNLFLANQSSQRSNASGGKIIKNVLNSGIPKEVKIINEEVVPANSEEVEYEEVEVTDEENEEEEYEEEEEEEN